MSDNQWHLSKSVPISIVLGLVLQFAGVVWMFSQMDAAIQTNANRIERHEVQIENMRISSNLQAVQLGRIETNIDAMRKSLDDVARALRERP